MTTSIGIVGGGILGLATARELLNRRPDLQVTVLEKEPELGLHQTGRNSGVVHTGIYYTPGSLKARLCTHGRLMLKEYCRDRDLPYEECGKLVIATNHTEETRLRAIHERAIANRVPGIRLLRPSEITELEPNAVGSLALHAPAAAMVDFRAIARAYAHDVQEGGGEVLTSRRVTGIDVNEGGVSVSTGDARENFDRLVVCAGLQSDLVAELSGDDADPRIIPFRGDYLALRPERTQLVRGLIYPVPDPRYPFLGIHLTRTIDGEVLVGPNAILAFAREGYKLSQVRFRELRQTLAWRGFRAMAAKHWRTGALELYRDISKRAFVRQVRRYVPAIRASDVMKARSGIRAQAVAIDGALVDDFRITQIGPVTNVRNAPSPAATSSLAIAEEIVQRVLEVRKP
jgi:L-2-hydroxyglutarate oxidase